MPHAVDQSESLPRVVSQEERDEEADLINQIIGGGQLEELDSFHDRALDIGEKADDAQDFEDIADDDLADEEDLIPINDTQSQPQINHELNDDDGGLFEDDEGDDLDDLFGTDDQAHSPSAEVKQPSSTPNTTTTNALDALFSRAQQERSESVESVLPPQESSPDAPDVQDEESGEEDDDTREQRLLFQQARERMRRTDNRAEPPPPAESNDELFSLVWSQFDPTQAPRFNELLPGKKAYYLSKTPLKPPKPVNPTKLSLEIQQDQEKNFKLPGLGATAFHVRRAEAEAKGLVLIEDNETLEEHTEDELQLVSFDDTEDVGGVSWQDLVAVCEDWDIPDGASSIADIEVDREEDESTFDVFEDDSWNIENDSRPAKKRKISDSGTGPLKILYGFNTILDDPEHATSRLANKVQLDLNDPHLLIDIQQPSLAETHKRRIGGNLKRDNAGGLTRDLTRRYNISNDEAYDLLKENHQSKIRSTLGNLAIEHSLPATKLQFPFYKVKLSNKEARSFHRPSLGGLGLGAIYFDRPKIVKKKHLRGRDVQSIFEKAIDLSLGDNSHVLLLEYSEEYPAMLSSFGMGNRLINYYRRKDNEDTSRPKLDIGETAVLLPQDKSPFAIFGDVDPGQTTPTIHNAMFRAPVFKHAVNHQDFLVIKNHTGVEGTKWYMRNMENLHVVGQEFPAVEVPGTHSRKVTDAAKKRLRMLSYRIFKRNKRLGKPGALKNDMILKHLPGSDIPQNRSKMREFMDYDKDRGWLPRKGEAVPDEATIRSWLKPEDIALLDSMQVGDRQLQDAGYNKDEEEVDRDDEEDRDGQTLDQQLAPWQTSKNFLNACQGKAMLMLHGEGDPTGRGEAFSFIRTSMKGGFKEIGESIEDRLDAKRLKELGGHSYNVARQQKAYTEHIRRIWDGQALSLSSGVEHENEVDMEDAIDGAVTPAFNGGRNVNSAFGKPRRDDETASVFSRTSVSSQSGKVLKITRHVRDKYGKEEMQEEIIRDPKVMREYIKRRKALDLNNLSFSDLTRTGDEDFDARQQKLLEEELRRLERNRERRLARDKAKGITTAASPTDAQSPPEGATPTEKPSRKNNAGTTQRKCANCGQVGHIKTNKKLCPICTYMSTPLSQHNQSKITK